MEMTEMTDKESCWAMGGELRSKGKRMKKVTKKLGKKDLVMDIAKKRMKAGRQK